MTGLTLESMAELIRYQMFFSALPVAFGILHFVLYLFNRRLKEQFYYALCLFFFALATFIDYQVFLYPGDRDIQLYYMRVHRILVTITPLLFLRFIYSIFYRNLPKRYLFFAALITIAGSIAVVDPDNNFKFLVIASLMAFIEIIRTFLKEFRSKDGAFIIGIGLVILCLFSSYDTLLDLNIMSSIFDINNAYMWGQLGFFISMSVFLGRDFAESNRKLIEQEGHARRMEAERKIIEAEDRRKSIELEGARKLQLSLLPECVNDIPGFDICFHMETATEVGGDYYDYFLAEDGTLTIGLGDATGHGMNAGLIVAIMKSLFASNVDRSEIVQFLHESSAIIKQMRLGNLFMAFMLVKIKENKLTVSSAGMPPLFIYRKTTGSIEEILIKGMPLGGPGPYPYEKREIELSTGDIVLMMSDGFPELFNEDNEMLDYERIKTIICEAADNSSTDIVRHFQKAGENWRKNRPQDDDITFAVIKVKEENEPKTKN